MTDKPDHSVLELETSKIPFATDGLESPTIFIDVVKGAYISAETTKLGLIQYRPNLLTDEIVAVQVATLVLPTSQIPAWAKYFGELAARPPFAPGEVNVETGENG